jgi:hypothetical protein
MKEAIFFGRYQNILFQVEGGQFRGSFIKKIQ